MHQSQALKVVRILYLVIPQNPHRPVNQNHLRAHLALQAPVQARAVVKALVLIAAHLQVAVVQVNLHKIRR